MLKCNVTTPYSPSRGLSPQANWAFHSTNGNLQMKKNNVLVTKRDESTSVTETVPVLSLCVQIYHLCAIICEN